MAAATMPHPATAQGCAVHSGAARPVISAPVATVTTWTVIEDPTAAHGETPARCASAAISPICKTLPGT